MGGLVHVEDVMGTSVTLDIRWTDATPARLEAALVASVTLLHHIDRVFSTWKSDSEISRFRAGTVTVAQCSAEVHDVIELCAQARELSGCWFDAWKLPGGFDPTGLVKGWAARRVSEALTAHGLDRHCVNAGGDVTVRGTPTDDDVGWRVGIADPGNPLRLLTVVVALAGGVATSAAYERGPLAIDPHTRLGVAPIASATVLGPDLALADALATGATAGGLAAMPALERAADYEALLVLHTGRVVTTSGWPEPAADGGLTAQSPADAAGRSVGRAS